MTTYFEFILLIGRSFSVFIPTPVDTGSLARSGTQAGISRITLECSPNNKSEELTIEQSMDYITGYIHKDKVRAGGEEPAGSSSKLLPVPLKQEITEALDIEKRKDMIVIRGIQESEDMDEKVGMIILEERVTSLPWQPGYLGVRSA